MNSSHQSVTRFIALLYIKMIILLSVSYSNLAQRQPSIIEHQTVQFISEWEAAVNRRIWTILPQRTAEFREPTRGIWQNFPRKIVVPTNNCTFWNQLHGSLFGHRLSTVSPKNRTATFNMTNSPHLLIISGRERPYSILNKIW